MKSRWKIHLLEGGTFEEGAFSQNRIFMASSRQPRLCRKPVFNAHWNGQADNTDNGRGVFIRSGGDRPDRTVFVIRSACSGDQ